MTYATVKREEIAPAMDLEAAARIIDAASCITILYQKYKQPGVPDAAEKYRYRLVLLVRRSREKELKDIVDAVGVEGGISPIHARVKERGVILNRTASHYELNWVGETAIKILELILPFLHERKNEATLAIKFWHDGGYVDESGKQRRGPVPDKFWPIRDKLYEQMRELKASLECRTRVVSEQRDLAVHPDSRKEKK